MNYLWFSILLMVTAVSGTNGNQLPIHEEHGTYINRTTSAFVKIIKTKDVQIQDPIYSVPAVVFIGKSNGNILRCLYEDPDECELYYRAGSFVYSLLITGEHLYAALHSGAILKCDLMNKNSCKVFHKCVSPVFSLTVGGGYLHVGVNATWTIFRCNLNEPNSCRPFHYMDSAICSLLQSEEHVYAGLWNGHMMRCSLRTDNTCAQVYNVTSGIMGLANVGDSILALAWNGMVWNCTRKLDTATDYCQSVLVMNKTRMWDMVSFNGILYFAHEQSIYICNWGENTKCSIYGHHNKTVSIAFAYSTHDMQSRYKNEKVACTWQRNQKCPPFVTYYDPEERSMFEVHVKDGKLRNAVGDLVDTTYADEGTWGPAAIFAMGPDGRVLLSNTHKHLLLHTSSLFAGNPVSGAGEMVVERGIIKNMTTWSKHYRPNLELNRQVVVSLRSQGYTDPINMQACNEVFGCVQNMTIK